MELTIEQIGKCILLLILQANISNMCNLNSTQT